MVPRAHLYTVTGAVRSARPLRTAYAMEGYTLQTTCGPSRTEHPHSGHPVPEGFPIPRKKGGFHPYPSIIVPSKSSNEALAVPLWRQPLIEAVNPSPISGMDTGMTAPAKVELSIQKSSCPIMLPLILLTALSSGTVWRKWKNQRTHNWHGR